MAKGARDFGNVHEIRSYVKVLFIVKHNRPPSFRVRVAKGCSTSFRGCKMSRAGAKCSMLSTLSAPPTNSVTPLLPFQLLFFLP